MLLVLVVSQTLANPQSQSYGPPSSSTSNSFNGNSNFNRNQDAGSFQNFRNGFSAVINNNFQENNGNGDGASLGANIQGPKVFRHISLFIAPQDQDDKPRLRTIRPPGGSDKHVQIIFVKAPSQSSAQQTEVELPPQPEQKTLVYVLVKKPEEGVNNVKIRGPRPTKPPAPEVYFIKYKDASNGASAGGYSGGQAPTNNNLGASFGTNNNANGGAIPVRSTGSVSTSYGAP